LELHDAKQHLRVDHSEDDAAIVDLIKAAHEYLQALTELTFTTTSYRSIMQSWPNDVAITLAHPPVSAVTSFAYYDEDDASQTFTSYLLKSDGNVRSRILLDQDTSWPNIYDRHDAITIDYTAGIGADASALPATVRHAMRLLVAHWYDNREGLSPGPPPKPVQHSLNGLVAQLKTGRAGGTWL
jgi:uncharacterized phiE125 gp8 family phage protein